MVKREGQWAGPASSSFTVSRHANKLYSASIDMYSQIGVQECDYRLQCLIDWGFTHTYWGLYEILPKLEIIDPKFKITCLVGLLTLSLLLVTFILY